MSHFLPWEQDRDAFGRCVTYHLLDPFPGVLFRDPQTRKIVINIGPVAYFKNDQEFFLYCEQNEANVPTWVKRAKDLPSFQKTLQYVVDFLRRIEVYGSTVELMDEYEKKIQSE